MLASLYSRRRWDAVPVEEFSFFLVCFFCSRKRLESMFFCKCVLLWNEVDSNLISCFYRKFFTRLYATVLTPSKACFRASNSLVGTPSQPQLGRAYSTPPPPRPRSCIDACYARNVPGGTEMSCGMSVLLTWSFHFSVLLKPTGAGCGRVYTF